jgi:hypothetical protein
MLLIVSLESSINVSQGGSYYRAKKDIRIFDFSTRKEEHSESETCFEESDNTSNAGATTWVKEDKMPNVGSFTGNPGVKQVLSDPTKE